MARLTCHRELTIDKSADEVWDYLSDLSSSMTVNQFHVGVDYDLGGKSPKRGMVVPIHHNVFGHEHVRLASVQIYERYAIGWGERLDDPNKTDTFPHSESWRIEPAGPKRCTVRNYLRGAIRQGPLSVVLGEYLWSITVPPILDADLRELAWRIGASDSPPAPLQLPPEHAVISRLVAARTIDGEPVDKLLADLLPDGAAMPVE